MDEILTMWYKLQRTCTVLLSGGIHISAKWKKDKLPDFRKQVLKLPNGMSSMGYLGRYFETARTAWWSTPKKKFFKKFKKK
jgi:hypothetical protein